MAAIVANADACVAWLDAPDLAEARAVAERALVQFNQVIQEIVALAAGQASRNQAQVTTELIPALPDVLGDRVQLQQQVLLNLINNGMEAMAQSAGRASQLTIRSASQDGGHVRISVEDNGMEVNNEVMARLFEPFLTTKMQGIGLGLAISGSIIEAHGRRLSAESHTGQGSVFQFTLPRAEGTSA